MPAGGVDMVVALKGRPSRAALPIRVCAETWSVVANTRARVINKRQVVRDLPALISLCDGFASSLSFALSLD